MKSTESRTSTLTNVVILGIGVIVVMAFLLVIVLGLGGDVLLSWIPVDRSAPVG